MRPSGTVTFVFTDIEGSTQLWERFPEAMKVALAQHDVILRRAIESQQGTIVKTTGDGLHAAFDSPADALQAVLDAQRTLLAQSWPETGPLRVRLALHTGEAEWRDGDYYGSAVNRTARLMSLASGGQILVSAATAALTGDQLPEGAQLDDLGQHRLQGLLSPERVYQLVHPDLPADFPPLRSEEIIPNNLPALLTTFIGREREVEELKKLLKPVPAGSAGEGQGNLRPRLITLTGPGGTGKTRLSLQVASQVLNGYPDGVWLVELAPVSDPGLVVQAVAAPLSVREQPGRPLEAILADTLQRKQLLLLLDNCEHLIDECARLADIWLQACPKLRILASSREALGIGGEQAFRVRSLALPPGQNGLSMEELGSYEAIRLFVDRAQAVKADFVLTGDNADAVLQICRRLDGIPLAIELAVARVRVLSPEQIAARLDDRFRLLTGGSRTALPRQRTLQALIDWSYDLLSEPECVVLRRLSVFSNGWALEAAEAVAGVEPIEPYDVLDLLEQLVNKSLVVAEESELGVRYRMLETVRQYAQEKLAVSGEADVTRDRHLAYFVELSQQAAQAWVELRPGDWYTRVLPEGDNLRAARAWALEHDLKAALQLVATVSSRWNRILPAAEALRFAEKALAQAEASPMFLDPETLPEARRLLAAGLASASWAAFAAGLNPRALEYAVRAAEIAEEEGDLMALTSARGLAATAAVSLGDMTSAQKWSQQALALAAETDNRFMMAMALIVSLSPLSGASLDSEENRARWEQGMAMLRQGGDLWGLGMGHQIAALGYLFTGNSEAAVSHAEQSLAFYTEVGDVHFANIPRSVLADVARQRGELDRAAALYPAIMLVWRNQGNLGAVARCMECLAFISHAQALRSGEDARIGGLNTAAALLGAADGIRQAHESPMTAIEQPEYDAELSAIREALGEDTFNHEWQRGRLLDLDQAMAFVLDEYPGFQA
jgi:predicted ATPase/class 3 adenylate cyclase